MGALLFGALVAVAFALAARAWPNLAGPLFFWLGLGLAIFFSIGAAIVRPHENMGGVPEVIVMNVVWGLGYGWLLPVALGAMGV
jgi:hypothetical protein